MEFSKHVMDVEVLISKTLTQIIYKFAITAYLYPESLIINWSSYHKKHLKRIRVWMEIKKF